MSPYSYLDHTADTGIVATGATMAEVFASAAEGLAAWLCEPDTVVERESREIVVTAEMPEDLLIEWLNEINFIFETDGFTFRRFEVRDISDRALTATGFGEPFEPSRHRHGEQVKAVTYHNLKLVCSDGGWTAQVILDV